MKIFIFEVNYFTIILVLLLKFSFLFNQNKEDIDKNLGLIFNKFKKKKNE